MATTYDSDTKRNSIYGDTSSILYNYAIARTLFDSVKNKNAIENEVLSLLNLQIDLILAFNNNVTTSKEQVRILSNIFFKDVINEQGQLGNPLIKIDGVYREVLTVHEFRTVVRRLNFREKMSMLRNFVSTSNDCIMYSILIEYKASKKSDASIQAFVKKYPMLNTSFLDETILLIENILGFDIEETANCYDNLNGNILKNVAGCKPLYSMIQADFNAKPTQSPLTVCGLWHTLIYRIPYQSVVKLPSDNAIKKLTNSFTGNMKEAIPECMNNTYSQYPLFPPLSEREQRYIKSKGAELKTGVDGLYTRPPWTPPICYMKPIEPFSFSVNLQNRYKKYAVSNLSGHVMLFLIMAKYFNGINLNLIILANILFMVPYNHSIHEIFQAAKMMGINTNYSIQDTDLNNINAFLKSNGLVPIVLPKQASWVPSVDRKSLSRSSSGSGTSSSYSKGGKVKAKRRHTRRLHTQVKRSHKSKRAHTKKSSK
jgi:hypothetical protein